MSLLILYLFIAVGISFLCSILEAVFLSITPFYVELEASRKDTVGILLKRLKDRPDQSLSSILILNTFAHTIGAAGVGSQAVIIFGPKWEAVIAITLTLIILYFSEILPKTIGTLYWRSLVRFATYTIRYLIIITTPLIWISKIFTKKLRTASKVTREEIEAIAELGEREGVLRSAESDLIENLLALRNFKARHILSPRSVVFSLEKSMKIISVSKSKELVPHSRIPVYDKEPDNVIGLVFSKTLLHEIVCGNEKKKVGDIAVPIFRVNENIPVLKLIDLFISRKEHMFLVVDQFEQMLGLVTLEDAIETLLGMEIMDEMDTVEDMQELAKQKADHWRSAYENIRKKNNKPR